MPKTSELPTATSAASSDTFVGLVSGVTSQITKNNLLAGGGLLSRAEALALTDTSNISVLAVYHVGVVCYYEKDASGTALTTADGQNWAPLSGSRVTAQHWEDSTVGHQACWDYAHTNNAAIHLAADITVTATEYWGNLTLIAAGGTINITGDSAFAISAGGGPRASDGCIIMRGANVNTDYGEAFTTQYEVVCIGRIPVRYARSDANAPTSPFLFTGLKEGSVIDFDSITNNTVAGTGVGSDAEPVHFYFYNRCTVRGRYEVIFADSGQAGGLWLRDINLGPVGIAYRSEIHMDDVEAKHNGKDECLSIFTTGYPAGGNNGYIHVTGSCTCYSDSALGFSALNNSLEDKEGFYVNLDRVTVYADNITDGQPGAKFRSAHGQVGNISVFIINAASGASTIRGISFEDTDAIGSLPQVGNAQVIIQETLDCGDGVVNMIFGNADIQNLVTEYLSGASVPQYSVANARGTIIRGGDMCAGTGGFCNGLYQITGGLVRGALRDVMHVGPDVTVLWDTDDFGTFVLFNTSGSAPTTLTENEVVVFKPKIIATGSATPTRAVNTGYTDVDHDIDYWLDYDGAGGAPTNADIYGSARGIFRRTLADGSFAVTYRSDRIEWSSGTYTPLLTFNGGSTGLTASTQTGNYHIQDGVLFYDIYIVLTAKGSSTGGASISLPTTSLGVSLTPTADEGMALVSTYANMASVSSPTAQVATFFAAPRVRLFNQGATSTAQMTEGNFTDTSTIRVSGWVPLY